MAKRTLTSLLAVASLLVGGAAFGASTLPDNLVVQGSVTCTSITNTGDIALTQVNAAGGSANPFDYTGTLGIMNGSDNFTLFDVNITNANHTGGSNFVYVFDIAGITQDAQATETAILIGAGWDNAIDLDGNQVVWGADGGVVEDESSDDVLDLTFGAGTGNYRILTGNLSVGNGTPDVALDGEDFYVNGTCEVDGAARFDGAVTANSGATITGALAANGGISVDTTAFTVADTSGNVTTTGTLTVSGLTTIGNSVAVGGANADVTLSADTTGGNGGAKNEFVGLPRIKLVGLSTGTNGSTESTSYMDDTPSGEWTEVDAGTNVVITDDATIYRVGSNSLKIALAATAVAGDGVTHTIVGDNLEADEFIGFWIYSSVTLASGDLSLVLTDDGGARTFTIPAVATANKWTWVEVDISSLAAGTGDTVTEVKVLLTAQGEGALAAVNVYIDDMWKWDSADEEALGVAVVQDGVMSVSSVTATDASAASSTLVEATDYIVAYRAGNDSIVWLTDQSTANKVFLALVAY